ncbi:MAG: signal peptidase I [Deltaproteobacteria bacterium]|nr:signal peptidase I [Deltaproteobacteria bacterium]
MQQTGGGAGMIVVGIIYLAVIVLMIASFWKIFVKAGKPGWAAIVPIYNIVVLLNIIGKPVWWIILFCIPLVNFVIAIIVYVALAKAFGKGVGFAIGLLLLSFIFFPILGFGSAQYVGGGAAPTPAPAKA